MLTTKKKETYYMDAGLATKLFGNKGGLDPKALRKVSLFFSVIKYILQDKVFKI
jgi:hypothetical protein